MQSDGNSFCGDVVLDSFKMVNSDKDCIEDQKYEKRIFWDRYYEDFYILWVKKYIIKQRGTHKSGF